jgi:hypothetical protein
VLDFGGSHRDMLEHGSSIDPKVVKERDAWTAVNAKELAALGFMGPQQLVPALVYCSSRAIDLLIQTGICCTLVLRKLLIQS